MIRFSDPKAIKQEEGAKGKLRYCAPSLFIETATGKRDLVLPICRWLIMLRLPTLKIFWKGLATGQRRKKVDIFWALFELMGGDPMGKQRRGRICLPIRL